MDEITTHLKVLLRVTLLFLAACFMVWAFVPSFRSISLGLILGSSASYINASLLSMKMRKFSELMEGGTVKRMSLGFASRAAMAVLVVIVALRVPGINLYSAVAGLFLAQFALLFIGAAVSRRQK
ncbi:ATP synthase subunit I [Paenibacillus sp. UMB4589-SE434]|uniref:ATP synthase subunit I n=1 Tax=Paenibacillus sp. UMB4589-SE434 TaxID=3046314 RepID=UPI0025518977|nr:ATP synthase subunit I [Paenibacillus sp. UMB4589-SE434]MDK8181574.1 ATP synthase subunit I [Paenibacillus sp. UMB4589-SE434]